MSIRTKINKLFVSGLLAVATAVPAVSTVVEAGDRTTGDPYGVSSASRSGDERSTAARTARTNRYPIRGKLKSVDVQANKFTLGGLVKDRVFVTDSQTVFTRNGKVAKLADGVRGDEVGGLAEKQADGTVLAIKVRFGPKPRQSEAEGEPDRKQTDNKRTDEPVME